MCIRDRYLDVYPDCIKFYIEAYREMWEDEDLSLIHI